MTYKNLTKCLDGYWEKPWCELPEEQRQAWHEALGVHGRDAGKDGERWDGYKPKVRQEVAVQHDVRHDPAGEKEKAAWFKRYLGKTSEITEWERMPHGGIPSEAKVREDTLTRLRAELEEIKKAAPTGTSATSEAPESDKSSATLAGVSKREILSVDWPMPNVAPLLNSILNNIPKWVEPACNKVGRPGKGADGSHLWNPAILAVCLATRTPQKQWVAGKGALTNFLRTNFSDYFEQWEAAATDL